MAFSSYLCGLLMLAVVSEAAITTQDVEYMDGTTKLSGYIAIPDGSGPFPVVMHVHAWGGMSDFEKSRANRTATELGYIGFAVSVYNATETTQASVAGQAGMAGKMAAVQKYMSAPAMMVSRLAAAAAFVQNHTKAHPNKTAAVGYCFGGSAVLNFAHHGGAAAAKVAGVVSMHGGLSGVGVANGTWKSAQVLILNGASDDSILKDDKEKTVSSMTAAGVKWEFTEYGHAQHGFTHPKDSSAHFHYDKLAEERSWSSMTDFIDNSLGFKTVTPLQITFKTEEVEYKDGNVTLKGFVATPVNRTGPFPVVLHVHAWGGLTDFERSRANRTANELGYIGFAVSVYDQNETAKAAADMQGKMAASQKYGGAPEMVVSRLAAATTFIKTRALVDPTKISAVGYCFGGSAVLTFARLGGANASGVGSVASFHGSLGGVVDKESHFCPTRVAVYNGAKDEMISGAEISSLQGALQATKTNWEFTDYSGAGHGFTHPVEAGNDHFHFEKTAESRSWISMHHFLKDSFSGKGKANSSTCAKFVPEKKPDKGMGGDAECKDDNAAVEKAGGAWGVKNCTKDLCDGQYKDMMGPLCKVTCGLCGKGGKNGSAECKDDNAAVEKAGGAWGVKNCSKALCDGDYKDMMGPLCKVTCGLCGKGGMGGKGDGKNMTSNVTVKIVTSTGKIEIKISAAEALALTKDLTKAKTVFASSIATTLGMSADKVTITAIYVDGVEVAARRLGSHTATTVRVDWMVKAAKVVAAADLKADTLKTNIEAAAKAANVTINITAAPTVDTSADATKAPAANNVTAKAPTATSKSFCMHFDFAVFVLMLTMALPASHAW